MNLTQEQINIMNLCQGQHLVLAPPGTGKTKAVAGVGEHGRSRVIKICNG